MMTDKSSDQTTGMIVIGREGCKANGTIAATMPVYPMPLSRQDKKREKELCTGKREEMDKYTCTPAWQLIGKPGVPVLSTSADFTYDSSIDWETAELVPGGGILLQLGIQDAEKFRQLHIMIYDYGFSSQDLTKW